jgi:hypothetical protein
VLPYAALSRDPYAKFRKGDFQRGGVSVAVTFTSAWTFPPDVENLFPVPSCVLFANGTAKPSHLPATVLRFRGKLEVRDATPTMADNCLTAFESGWPADTGEGASKYREKFRQGATLVPRRLVIVERIPSSGRLGSNPHAPQVRGRTSGQDDRRWKPVNPLDGPIEIEFLQPVYLGESIAPYRILKTVSGIIPWNANKREVMDSAGAYNVGKRLLAEWLAAAQNLWEKHGTGSMTLAERWNYGGAITAQFPIPKVRVLFAGSGTHPAAVKITAEAGGVIEHALYWMGCNSLGEADYLCAILNSEATRRLASKWQSEGQFGTRHFDKVVFNLPIPIYEPTNSLHRKIAAAAAQAEKLAEKVEVKEGEYFTRSRKRIRAALIANGVAGRIETMVAELIGVAPVVITADDASTEEPEDAD